MAEPRLLPDLDDSDLCMALENIIEAGDSTEYTLHNLLSLLEHASIEARIEKRESVDLTSSDVNRWSNQHRFVTDWME